MTAPATVLVVEDDADVRRFICTVLQSNGLRPIAASDATAALSAAARETISLLITDLVLPDGSGIALAQTLAATHPGLSVIVVSGYSDGTLAPHLPSGYRFLGKPFTVAQLMAVVTDALVPR
jgi:DNA-binding NtrC family response regulator